MADEQKKKRKRTQPTEEPYIDPRLDPKSPDFDQELYIENGKKTKQSIADLKAAYIESRPDLKAAVGDLLEQIKPYILKATEATDIAREVGTIFSDLIETISESVETLKEAMGRYKELMPYIEEECKNPENFAPYFDKAMTFDEFAELPEDDTKEKIWQKLLSAAEQAKNKAQMPTIPAILQPKSYKMLNSKIVNSYCSLQDIFLSLSPDGQLTMLPGLDSDYKQEVIVRDSFEKKVGKDQRQVTVPAVTSMVSLSYSGDLEGRLARLNYYDQSIMDSIVSIYTAGFQAMTLEDIWRHQTQYSSKNRPTQSQLDRIDRACKKFGGTRIYLDISGEIKSGLISDDGEKITPIIDEPLLDYTGITAKKEKSGKEARAIIVKEPPILYTYSAAKRLIITIPTSWLELPPKLSATEEVIGIRNYMLAEINQMIKRHRDNHVINYATLLRRIDVDIESISRKDKGRYTETVYKLLDYWRDKGIIKDYKIRAGKKNEVLGFEIVTQALLGTNGAP